MTGQIAFDCATAGNHVQMASAHCFEVSDARTYAQQTLITVGIKQPARADLVRIQI